MVKMVWFLAMSVVAGIFLVGIFFMALRIDKLERELKSKKEHN
jgi:hypothetical protein